MSDGTEAAGRTGRGFVWIAFAKVYFIVTGYAVALALPRLLTTDAFGVYSIAFNNMSIINNVLIVSTVQTVSRASSGSGVDPRTTLRRSLVLQLGIGSILAVVCLLGGPMFAERVLRNANVGSLLQVASAVPLSYSLYAAIVGYLNGCQRFSTQAKLDISFSTLRTVGILVGAILGFGALGSIAGYTLASGVVLLVAIALVGVGERGRGLPLREWLAFMAPIVLYQVCLNGVLLVDANVLSATTVELATSAGHSPREAETLAESLAGLYRGAQQFAFVPYQLNLSLTLVIFPMISRAASSRDLAATQGHIRRALRISLVMLLGIAAPVSGAARGVMRLAYPPEYLAASDALGILVLGVVFFALFVVCATVLSGAGRPAVAAVCAFVGLLVVIVGTRLFLKAEGIGDSARTLRALALGTSAGMLVALVCTAGATYAVFRVLVSAWTLVRVILASGASFLAAHFTPHTTRPMALVALIVGALVFAGVLIVCRELTRTDFAFVVSMIQRRKRAEPSG